MEEIWKDINDYEGLYQISNLGIVKSFKGINERILKQGSCSSGYKQVGLVVNNFKITTLIHKLVAIHFLNHIPNGKFIHIDHIDGNRLNNNLDNLRIVSSRDNTARAQKRKSKYIGVSHFKKSGKWIARLENNGFRKYLGIFKCETAAYLAYQKALREIQ